MKILKIVIALTLLGSLTISADPLKTWSWTDPVRYENGQNIPTGDLITRTLKCGNTSGGPYSSQTIFVSQSSPSVEDMVFVVGGVPGTYYCVSTVWSLEFLSESGPSNEANFIVVPGALGFVPNPPVLTLEPTTP